MAGLYRIGEFLHALLLVGLLLLMMMGFIKARDADLRLGIDDTPDKQTMTRTRLKVVNCHS